LLLRLPYSGKTQGKGYFFRHQRGIYAKTGEGQKAALT